LELIINTSNSALSSKVITITISSTTSQRIAPIAFFVAAFCFPTTFHTVAEFWKFYFSNSMLF